MKIVGKKKYMENKIMDKRLYHVDILRILAAVLVIFNHTGTWGFSLFTKAQDSKFYLFYMVISILDKIDVPIFFMISGALLLSREVDFRQTINRIWKCIVLIVGASFLVYTYKFVFCEMDYFLTDFWSKLYTCKIDGRFWFLYSYLAFLIMLPLLQKLVVNLKRKDFYYLFILHIIFVGIIPMLEYVIGGDVRVLTSNINIVLVNSSFVFYPIMGYYVENVLDVEKFDKKIFYKILFANFIVILITCIMTQYKINITGICNENESQTFHSCLISIPTVSVYCGVKYLFMKIKMNSVTCKIISELASVTLGVYLLEEMIRDRTSFILGFLYHRMHLRTLPSCIVYVLAVFVICGAITYLLKRIPVIKDYL